MRTLIMLAAAGGISCFSLGASAAPLAPDAMMVQKADYYCGAECQRHRYWEQRRAEERHEQWRESHEGYPNGAYYRNRGY
jgi:hypothetical protein